MKKKSTAFVLDNPDYSNQKAVPDFADYFARWRRMSEPVVASAGAILDVPYGPGWRQTLDILPVEVGCRKPVFVFIHGGWWYFLDKRDYAFVLEPFHERGCVCVNIGYPLAPVATIGEIVQSVRRALVWVHQNIERFGGDPDDIHIAGHSAGGHLATMAVVTDWSTVGGPLDLVKSGCSISGLFDLVEILSVPQNASIRMLPDVAHANSPIRLIPSQAGPLTICVGGDETPGFRRQHENFVKAWKSESRPLVDASMPGENHFGIIEQLARPESPLFKAVFAQIERRAVGR